MQAQQPAFYHLSTAEGLSDNFVTSCARDKNGILWIGTTEGLNSFDGNSITAYHKYQYPLLAGNSIGTIIVDPENKIWIRSNSNSINMLDEKRKFRLFTVGDSVDKTRVNSIFFLNSKGIIALKGKQHFVIKNKTSATLEKLTIPEADKLPSIFSLVNNVNADTLFFYGDSKLVLYDYANMKIVMSVTLPKIDGITSLNAKEMIAYTQEGDVFYRISIPQKKIIKEYRNLVDQFGKPISGSLRNSTTINENIIVITSRFGGIYYVDFNKERVTNYEHDPLDPKSLGGNNTYGIKYDKHSGYLFVTTLTSGLHFYNTRINQAAYKSYFIDGNNEVFDGYIQAITTAKDGTIWMGAQDRLISWNREKNKSVYVPCDVPGSANTSQRETIRAVRFDDKENLWVGTSTKGILILNPQLKTIVQLSDTMPGNTNTIRTKWINAICPDTKGNMWVGTISGTSMVEKESFKVHDFTNHPVLKKISNIACASIWVDKKGCVWIGSTSGAWCYDENKNTLTQYNTDKGLAHNTVLAMNEDDIGNYYFATAEGLSVLSKDGIIKNYNRSNGLRNDRCEGILKDENGFIWIVNLSCILRYDPNSKKFAVYEDGNGFRMRTGHRSGTGEMFWGTNKGLTYFYPGYMNNISQPLNPSINTLFISDSAFHFTGKENLLFPYNTSSFVFNFSSGELSGGKKIQFLYRLAGYDNEWQIPVTAGQAAYSKLQPGEYRFEIKVSRDGNTWYDAKYPIIVTVNKPWWQQTWFRLFCLFFVSGVFFFLYRRYKKNKAEKEAKQVIDYFAGSTYERSSVDNILWDICRNCIYMLRFEDCVIYLLDEEKKLLIQKAAYGPKNPREFEIINPINIPLGKGIVGHVAGTGKAVIINDTSADPRYIVDDEKRLSEIAVPIIHEGKVIGIIDSENRKKNFFTQQ
ncbi:MAG: two-component regulator propeller domain-containing protein, partial [Ferruginibacter sp.]